MNHHGSRNKDYKCGQIVGTPAGFGSVCPEHPMPALCRSPMTGFGHVEPSGVIGRWSAEGALVFRPDPVVVSDKLSLAPHPDPVHVGCDLDPPADQRGVHRVVVAVQPHVMVPRQPGRGPPPGAQPASAAMTNWALLDQGPAQRRPAARVLPTVRAAPRGDSSDKRYTSRFESSVDERAEQDHRSSLSRVRIHWRGRDG